MKTSSIKNQLIFTPLFVSKLLFAFVIIFICFPNSSLNADPPKKPTKKLPIPGEVFSVKGRTAFLIMPTKSKVDGRVPWVWFAPTLPGYPRQNEKGMFERFLEQGIAMAGVDVGESFGSPKGRATFSALYEELVNNRNMSRKPCLLARSRGGLMLYNWAAENPTRVGGIAGIYPVCNLTSYPGLKRACGAYEMTQQQLAEKLAEHNPIDRLAPLAKANVPIFHIHGDIDKVVPLEKNSQIIADRYAKLGGKMTLKIFKGQGHNLWPGWFECEELIDFMIASAK